MKRGRGNRKKICCVEEPEMTNQYKHCVPEHELRQTLSTVGKEKRETEGKWEGRRGDYKTEAAICKCNHSPR